MSAETDAFVDRIIERVWSDHAELQDLVLGTPALLEALLGFVGDAKAGLSAEQPDGHAIGEALALRKTDAVAAAPEKNFTVEAVLRVAIEKVSAEATRLVDARLPSP